MEAFFIVSMERIASVYRIGVEMKMEAVCLGNVYKTEDNKRQHLLRQNIKSHNPSAIHIYNHLLFTGFHFTYKQKLSFRVYYKRGINLSGERSTLLLLTTELNWKFI